MERTIDYLIRNFAADKKIDYVSYLSLRQLREELRSRDAALDDANRRLDLLRAGLPEDLVGWDRV